MNAKVKHYGKAILGTLAIIFFPITFFLLLFALAFGGAVEIILEDIIPLWSKEHHA